MNQNNFKDCHILSDCEDSIQRYETSQFYANPDYLCCSNDHDCHIKNHQSTVQQRTLLSPQSSVSRASYQQNSSFHFENEEQNIIVHKNLRKLKSSLLNKDKNSGKNLCRALKCYIASHFDSIQKQVEPLKRFLALKPDQCGRIKLQAFLNTLKGNQIGWNFFGNYQWGKFFIETSKIDITQMIQSSQQDFKILKQD